MTLQEFKAWFEGFTEYMDASPNKKQWERIKRRVKEIDGAVTTYQVFVDRYWPLRPPYPHTHWGAAPYTLPTVWCSGGTTGGVGAPTFSATECLDTRDLGPSFNSAQAMLALGKADYQSAN